MGLVLFLKNWVKYIITTYVPDLNVESRVIKWPRKSWIGSAFISIYIVFFFEVSYHLDLNFGVCLNYRWILSKAKKDDTDDEIAKYDGEI